MQIRLATTYDLEEISKCHKASIRWLCKDYYSPESIDKWTNLLLPEIYESAIQEKVFIVAEQEGNLSGFGILDIKNKEISAIYVHPNSKGIGIGKKILFKLEAISLEKNIYQLHLCSTINASDFYKRHGYVENGTDFHELPDGTQLECIKMNKVIGENVSRPRNG